MRKPDWSLAPEWAMYAAQDQDSSWYYYEVEPWQDNASGDWHRSRGSNTRMKEVEYTMLAYPLLEKRP